MCIVYIRKMVPCDIFTFEGSGESDASEQNGTESECFLLRIVLKI